MTGRFKDLSGQTIGALLIIERTGSETLKNGNSYATWLCQCECGQKCIVNTFFLIKRRRPDCGKHGRAKKHGHSGNNADVKPSSTYSSWKSLIARCTQPSSPAYAHYQSRGITLCERWRSFENFLADMGERPDGTTLDRIENDKGYFPGNCRWADKRTQGNNRVTNIHFVYKGKQYTLADLARETGVAKETLRCRLVRPGGWTVEAAVETPVMSRQERGRRGGSAGLGRSRSSTG